MMNVIFPDKNRCIGKGSYGQVFLTSNPHYVCKIFDSFRDGIHEYSYVSTLNSKAINNCRMPYHSIVYREEDEQLHIEYSSGKKRLLDDLETHFIDPEEEEDKVFIILNKFDYNLNAFNRRLKLKAAKWPLKLVLFELFKSYDNLYQNFLIHGDIKMDNILVKREKGLLDIYNYKVALCDFSLTFLHLGEHLKGDFTQDDLKYIQTVNYRSPELILGNTDFDYKIDIWSIGIIILKLFKDINFFKGKDAEQQINFYCRFFGKRAISEYCQDNNLEIGLPGINYRQQKDKNISSLEADDTLVDLIDRMLELNPKKRIDLGEIFLHPYFINSNLIYPFRERESEHFLNMYFIKHPVKHENLKESSKFNRIEEFLKIYSFLIKNKLSIKLLFQTIYLFDHLTSHNIIEGDRISFIAILKILGYQRLYEVNLLPLISNKRQPDKEVEESFESKYYGLLAKLKHKINVFCYLDYLSLIDIPDNYSTRQHGFIWILFIFLIANVQHYQYRNIGPGWGKSISTTLVTLDRQPETKPKLYNNVIADLCLRTYLHTNHMLKNKYLTQEQETYLQSLESTPGLVNSSPIQKSIKEGSLIYSL